MTQLLLSFPSGWRLDIGTVIDDAINALSVNGQSFFSAIRDGVLWLLNVVEMGLTLIPWWLAIALVGLAGYFISKRIRTGILYAAMLFAIGLFGLWDLMLQTLTIVIVSVFFSLLFGFPIGILISMSRRAERIVRPILDLMQTLPAFVYLVPTIILFSVGKMPAVIATIIYSIVPIIRMTSHGIRNVDKEVVEASVSFGASRMQTLFKVQIPQALPTIMTGVNQTIMMAMSMVVTCALIGANGLGMEILVATNRMEVGQALLPGIAIVFLAILLDRLTQGLIKKEGGKQK